MGPKDRMALLPVSGSSQDGDSDVLIKGSYMSKRGMYAAVSYMACAGRLKIDFFSFNSTVWLRSDYYFYQF